MRTKLVGTCAGALLLLVAAAPPESSVESVMDTLGVSGHLGFQVLQTNAAGPAHQAGIRKGDLLIEFDGVPFSALGPLAEIAGMMSFLRSNRGRSIEIGYLRGREIHTAVVEVATLQESEDRPTLGILGMPVFVITEVSEAGRGKRMGLQPDDVVLDVIDIAQMTNVDSSPMRMYITRPGHGTEYVEEKE